MKRLLSGCILLRKITSQKILPLKLLIFVITPCLFYNEPVGASQLASVGYSNEVAKRWAEKIEGADGFIIVTPEYNHGYSAVLKNAIDYVYDGWNKKPVAFVSYGGPAGGSRAIEQLRQVAIELQMHPVREQVTIPYIWSALSDSGELIDEGEHFKHGAESMIRQLMAYTTLFSSFRKQAIN